MSESFFLEVTPFPVYVVPPEAWPGFAGMGGMKARGHGPGEIERSL